MKKKFLWAIEIILFSLSTFFFLRCFRVCANPYVSDALCRNSTLTLVILGVLFLIISALIIDKNYRESREN